MITQKQQSTSETTKQICPQCQNVTTKLAFACPQCGHEFVKGGAKKTFNLGRPKGVWFVTIYFALFAGFFPGFMAFKLFFSDAFETLYYSPFGFAFSLLLSAIVIVSAIGTWLGNNKARIVFIVAVTIYYLLLAFNNLALLTLDQSLPSNLQIRSTGRIFRSILYPTLIIWYFTRPPSLRFFRKTSA